MKKYAWPLLIIFVMLLLPSGADSLAVKVPQKHRKAKTALVKWDAQPEAVSYDLKLMTKKGRKIKVYKNVTGHKKQLRKKHLITNKPYSVKVRGIDGDGEKLPWSGAKKFRTKPAKVRELAADNYTAISVDLRWNQARGKGLTYKIRLYDSQGNCRYELETASNCLTLPVLTHGNEYQAKVRAKYDKKNLGRWSSKLIFPY